MGRTARPKGELMDPQEPVGDYGYDMAHEDVQASRGPAQPPTPDPGRTAPAHRPPELDQDYGYDEAHSF